MRVKLDCSELLHLSRRLLVKTVIHSSEPVATDQTLQAAQGHAASLQAVQALLGHRFADLGLLAAALTHSSFIHEHPEAGPTYERLEFVGDAVVGVLCARLLYTQFPDAAEGELSRRRARVVRRDGLAKLAQQLNLGPHVRVGSGPGGMVSGPGARILADVLEAIVGALFLDAGLQGVSRAFEGHFKRAIEATTRPQDFKTRLQEAAYAHGLGVPTYAVEAQNGPSHALVFCCVVQLAGRVYGRGEGTSKKAAEQICARQALGVLQMDPSD